MVESRDGAEAPRPNPVASGRGSENAERDSPAEGEVIGPRRRTVAARPRVFKVLGLSEVPADV